MASQGAGAASFTGQAASLLASSSFNSRFEKELQLGSTIEEMIAGEIPRGSLRAVSAVWLGKYLDYIRQLA